MGLALLFMLFGACAPAPPGVEAVTPPGGPPGTVVTITGSGFLAGTTVTLGGRPLDDLVIIDERHVSGKAGALPAGEQDLVITTPAGATTCIPRAFAIPPPAGAAPSAAQPPVSESPSRLQRAGSGP